LQSSSLPSQRLFEVDDHCVGAATNCGVNPDRFGGHNPEFKKPRPKPKYGTPATTAMKIKLDAAGLRIHCNAQKYAMPIFPHFYGKPFRTVRN